MPRWITTSPTLKVLALVATAKGFTLAELSAACGVPITSLRTQASRHYARRAWIVERFLETPIWTEPKRYAALCRASDFIGVDFILTKFHPLRSAIVAKGVHYTRTLTHKDALLARVLEHISELEARREIVSPANAQSLPSIQDKGTHSQP